MSEPFASNLAEIEERLIFVECMVRELLMFVAGPDHVTKAKREWSAILEAINEGASPIWPHMDSGK
ncbi:MAG: hypothetical protein ACR2RF_14350 [Geminicoccaceae bacterium]